MNSIVVETVARGAGRSTVQAQPRFGFAGQRIGLRLLTWILAFSSLVTLMSTLTQLWFDYRRDVGAIEERLTEVERSYLGSLAGSLWHVDVDQLRLQLGGMLRLPDLQFLEVRETAPSVERPLVVAVGDRARRSAIAREYAITYDDRGTIRPIGTLYVQATLDNVYARLVDTAVIILVSQGVKTFVVSLFILYLVHMMVTRHLVAIARFVGDYDVNGPTRLLHLDRASPQSPDELDRMVGAFNAMVSSLEHANADLKAVNAALEQDILARKKAEEEVSRLNAALEFRVRQRTAELEAANSELASFSYSVSHDLRAPLRRIEGFSQMLADGCAEALDGNGRHYLDRIRAGAHEMADMVDSFLKLSRATRGELTVEPLDLSDMARDILAKLAEKEPERRVLLTVAANVQAEGDRRLMAVALGNLLENAWKYTRRTDVAIIEFGTERGGEHPVYFVRDNGAGFDQAFVDRLFTPFHRLHKAEEFEGTGIGLATVQRIVARHGGRVWAEGAIGHGAIFKFTCWEERGQDERATDPTGRG